MLMRKQLALVKMSGADGSTPTPDNSQLLHTTSIEVSPYEGDTQQRTRMREHMGAFADVNVAPYSTITVTVPLAGSGEVGTAPVFDSLLRACGHSVTEEVDTSVTYDPVSDDHESADIFFLLDGQQHLVSFAKGTATLNLTSKEFPTIQFTMTGFYNHPTNPSQPTIDPITMADELAVNKQNTVIDVHGFSACGQSFSLDVGNTIVHRNLMNCERIRLTDRVSVGQVNIEAPDLTTKDYFNAVESHEGVTPGVVKVTHGKTAGNIVEVATTKTQLSTISAQDSDGVVHYQMDMRHLPDTGDDEYAITFK